MIRVALALFFLCCHVVAQNGGGTIEIIAHRGAPKVAPENTMASFRKAVELGATMIELDVHQTRDVGLVVMHDAGVARTTDGRGDVGGLTTSEIRALDAGKWFSSRYMGERVPLLKEVLAKLPSRVKLLIEIKYGSEDYPGIEQRVVDLVREHSATDRVILKSFQDEVIETLARIAPDIPRLKIFVLELPLIPLVIGRGLHFGSPLDLPVQYVQVHWIGLNAGLIGEARKKGIKVFVWDVHTKDRMIDAIEMGVDGIETDYPDVLSRLLR